MSIKMKLVLRVFLALTATGFFGLIALLASTYLYINPQLPSVDTYRDYRYATPLRILAAGGELIAEFGTRRSMPMALADVPQAYIDALVSTEDKRFFSHSGIDWLSLANDAVDLLLQPEVRRGASTITMQLPRNVADLSREQTLVRKVKEMLLALKIERELTKNEILELYINVVPFGKHSYGVKAAAFTYYDKPPSELDLAQLAMLAGVPKLPEAGNPINGPQWAIERRNLVLRRMKATDKITQEQYVEAIAQPITAKLFHRELDLPSPYPAEIIRQELIERFGDEIYTGYTAYSTIDIKQQAAAQQAVKKELENYDRRYGYRGPEGRADLGEFDVAEVLRSYEPVWDLVPAVVTEVEQNSFKAHDAEGTEYLVEWSGIRWARPHLGEDGVGARPRTAGDVLAVGDVIRLQQVDKQWQLSQVPEVTAALVALDPASGGISAMVGGYSFAASQYNHATQAARQPGSGFKPIMYSAALDAGLSPASIFLDAPLVFDDDRLEQVYRPRNDSGRYRGPLRLREALYRSVNLVSIRVLGSVGADHVATYAERFGFNEADLPRSTQLAIGGGTMAVTPLEMVSAYAVFANSGYQVVPHLLKRVVNRQSEVVFEPSYPRVCENCELEIDSEHSSVVTGAELLNPLVFGEEQQAPNRETPLIKAERVVEKRNNFLINSMLRDVVRRGTGARAWRELGRTDLAGKTGTTDEATDTWFNGFHPTLAATVWVGFSTVKPLGVSEYGSTRPLSIWIDFMNSALENVPEEALAPPDGIVRVRIDAETGEFAGGDQEDAVFEYFRVENSPVSDSKGLRNRLENQLRPEDIF